MSLIKSISAHAQSIRDAIDVIEPGGDQCDLQNGAIVKTGRAQLYVIAFGDARGISRQLSDIVKHHALLFGDWRSPIVLLQRFDQLVIQGYATQKLCVRLDSIMTAVRDRDHGGDHLVLPARQRQAR